MFESQVKEVFDFWRNLHSNSRSRLDPARTKAISNMLKVGYEVEDLKLAILGCKVSDFHQGDNDRGKRYCSIELIFRCADKVDGFIELADREAAKLAKATAEKASTAEASEKQAIPPASKAKIEALLGRYRTKMQVPKATVA